MTKDVSYSGVFVTTDHPPQISQLTRIQIELPGTGQVFETHAMCVFSLELDNDYERDPGCGLKFYAMTEPSRRLWNQFVDSIRADAAVVAAKTPVVPSAPKRRQVRFRMRVAVRPESVGALERLYSEISTGAMCVEVRKRVQVGSPLRLDVVHPTSGAIFKLDGTVTRLVEALPGVEIQFDNFGDERRAEFVGFMAIGA